MSHTHLRVTRIDLKELFLPVNSSFSVIEKSTITSGLSIDHSTSSMDRLQFSDCENLNQGKYPLQRSSASQITLLAIIIQVHHRINDNSQFATR